MSKNKNKNKGNNNPPNKPQIIQPIKKTLNEEQKLEIEVKKEELENKMVEQSIEKNDKLSEKSSNFFKETEQKEDLPKYWEYVKTINIQLESLIMKAEEEKNNTIEFNKKLEGKIKDADTEKNNYKSKLEDINKKEKDLLQREFALDNGEYTTVIKNLLDILKNTEKKVFTDTENLIKELSDFHKKNIEEFSKYEKESVEYEKKLNELNREKNKFDIYKEVFEENLREELEIKYSEEANKKEGELNRLQQRLLILKSENSTLKQFKEDLQNAFNKIDDFDAQKIENILKEFQKTKQECEALNNELDSRPTINDLHSKKEQVELLEKEVERLKTENNEKEFLELKQKLFNQDTYLIEINSYKSKIESFEIREGSLKKTIKDLQETINQLKGEADKKTDAFEFAKKCDSDTKNLGINHIESIKKQPNNLAELCSYIQQYMAFKSEKPFYYSLETIRIFLAGLHMSPISILQGISGTGKTSLPREFAKALISNDNYIGIDENNQNKAPYRICAIQSGWRDNMDLMGYFNSFEHKYKETDFFKALYLANLPKYSDTLFFIILDEMNLSRPEHYFADFLSLLEQTEYERFINLTNTPEEVLPALIKGGKLKIPENIRFIGTANHDETTLEFAPKTYDRSNLMEIPKNHPDKKDFKENSENYNITYKWITSEFKNSENKYKTECEKFVRFTSELEHLLLADKNIGVGNRLENQAERFISVYLQSGNAKEKEKDLATAVDHLITSRLFRTLKNRYDLDKTNLSKFKEDYVNLFNNEFKHEPNIAIELLDNEIKKK